MRIDRDFVSGRCFNNAEVVAHRLLAVVPFKYDLTIGIAIARTACIGDIASLDAVNAQALVEGKGGFHLGLVIGDISGGFMMADQMNALGLCIVCHRFQIEIWIGGGEVKAGFAAKPIPIPARVPAFDQHAAKAMFSSKIDVALGIFRRRAMLRAAAPGRFVDVHLPPNADIFRRLDPRHIAQGIGLIEVEDQMAHHEACRIIADLDRPPRGGEGRGAHHFRAARTGRERRDELCALGLAQPHRRVIHQSGLVEGHMQAALGPHGHRRMGLANFADWGAVIEIFIAVPFPRWNPPSGAILGQIELGQFFANGDLF